jgi:membrane protease YdiL (CAAX protease family)
VSSASAFDPPLRLTPPDRASLDVAAGPPPRVGPLAPKDASRPPSRPVDRLAALVEVAICSGFPSQIALIYLLALAGYSPFQGGARLSLGYVGTLLLLDAAVLIGLIVWLLFLHGERPRDIFLGRRAVSQEALLGVPLTVVVFGLVFVVLTLVQRLAPWLHNVPQNPLEQLIRSPRDAILFAAVATVGGGLREEIQRAFILHRFDQHLGGAWVGIVLFSILFGAGHAIQGWDAAITTATLGAFWGLVYLSRGSIVAPVVSHSGFNTAEIIRFLVLRS